MRTFKIGLSTGAGMPTLSEVDSYVSSGAEFLRTSSARWNSLNPASDGSLPTNSDGTPNGTAQGSNLQDLDTFVQYCNSKHILVYLTVNGGAHQGEMNAWSLPFSVFCVNLAKRYQKGSIFGEVDRIEPGNEPNFKLWDPIADPAEYARLMEYIYPGVLAIGANRPMVMIGGIAASDTDGTGGMSMPNWTLGIYNQWVADGYSAAGAKPFPYDIWNTHRYTHPLIVSEALALNGRGWPTATVGNGSPNSGSQQIRESFGDGAKMHDCTEYGIPAPFTATQNVWKTKLSAAIDASTVLIPVANAGHLQQMSLGSIIIDSEVIFIPADGNRGTGARTLNKAVRGFDGTTPAPHLANAVVSVYEDATFWAASWADALAHFATEPNPGSISYFCAIDNPVGDAGKNFGIFTSDGGSPPVLTGEKPDIFDEYHSYFLVAPVCTVTAPTGTITDDTPDIIFTSDHTHDHYEVRVYTDAVHAASGFTPNNTGTYVPTFATGQVAGSLLDVPVTPSLPSNGTYWAFARTKADGLWSDWAHKRFGLNVTLPDSPPVATIVGPTGTITDNDHPDIQIGFSDPNGDPMDAYEVRYYSNDVHALSGFTPDNIVAFTPLFETGQVNGSLLDIPTDVVLDNNEEYWTYARVKANGVWSAWASGNWDLAMPVTPPQQVPLYYSLSDTTDEPY